MKISIITVNLNNKLGLERTMASVRAQTFGDFEYLIIDGGSSDGSVDAIRQQAEHLAYWLSEPDEGVYHAMNKGIAHACGEYLLFLNSGDFLIDKDVLERVAGQLDGTDILYGNLRYDRDGELNDSSYPETLSFGYLHRNYLPHPATFIRRTLFNQLGTYDERFAICADWVFFLKAIGLHRASYRYLSTTVAVYDTIGMSAQPEQQAMIQKERKQWLDEAFGFYIGDYQAHFALKERVKMFEKKKFVRLLKKLGLYKSLDHKNDQS